MQTIKMNISDLRHPEKNVRKHPQKQIKEMMRSVDKFGQYRPVVVDENNVILAGNGLVIAMREMGKTEIDVLKYDNLSENDKKKLMIADNQTASLGVDDYGAIEEIIRSLDGDFDVPGYDEESINMLIEESTAVVEQVKSYGIYPTEEVEQLRRVEQERADNGIPQVEQTYERPSVPPSFAQPPTPQPAPTPSVDDKVYGKTVSEGEKYVVCPHCGEKIYL